jgi:hypothetical protein
MLWFAMSTLDVLILVPAIPALLFCITWALPWERWIPWKKIPKLLLGPYALYLSFVAWHFWELDHWWVFVLLLIVGVVLCVLGIVEKVKKGLGRTALGRRLVRP